MEDFIGEWSLVEEIGSGGQSKVYEAKKGEGKETVAIKVIQVKKEYQKKLSRFEQEMKIHETLSSSGVKNVIPILDSGLIEKAEDEVLGYIVMPKAEVTLHDISRRFVNRLELSLEVFFGIVNGIKEINNAGVIHRDIKPSNVLFLDQDDLEPLVSDFGICLLKETPDSERLTSADETVGAKYFMAPEQERGGVIEIKESADIYALGKLLNFMLTGNYIHREHIDELTFTKDEMNADPRCEIIVEEILKRTIVEKEEDRIQNASELFDIISEIRSRFRTVNGD